LKNQVMFTRYEVKWGWNLSEFGQTFLLVAISLKNSSFFLCFITNSFTRVELIFLNMKKIYSKY